MLGQTKDGLPRALGPLKSYIRSHDPRKIRFVLTLLSVGRAFRPTDLKISDFSSITAPSTADGKVLGDIVMFSTAFAMRTLGINPVSTQFVRLHFTEKAGPSGNAILSSLNDYMKLTPQMRKDLLTIGGQRLQDTFDDIENLHPVAFAALSSY